MREIARVAVLGTATAVLGGITVYAHASPGVVACALIDAMPSGQDLDEHSELVTAARQRISDLFGTPKARPVLVFWSQTDFFVKLRLNQYASTHMIGWRACVFIGPKGQTVDIVAHELVHAEVFERVGAWARWTQVPVWFDEGLAMQVDYREKYVLPEGSRTAFIRNAASPADFFVADDQELTENYAAAKMEVARWVSSVGSKEVYARLARIQSGETFATAILAQ